MSDTLNKILEEFLKLNLRPLISSPEIDQNISCYKFFIKDSIYVISKIKKLRENLTKVITETLELKWEPCNNKPNIIEIYIRI